MPRGIADLPNLGPHIARRVVTAYRRQIFQLGREITLNALWRLEAALSGTDWRHLSDERKDELRRAA